METLAWRAASLQRLLVETAKTRYDPKPIPNEVDDAVSEFVEAYLAAAPVDRASAASRVGRDSFGAETLTVYSRRMAAMAVRTASSHDLELAVAAMMLAPGADFQEFDWTLEILYDAAKRIGRDPEDIFGSVVGHEPSGTRVMRIFQWKPEERRLKHNRAVMARDGFRYEPVLGSSND
jgi:hypothetical protein